MKIFILGSNGFVGKQLTMRLKLDSSLSICSVSRRDADLEFDILSSNYERLNCIGCGDVLIFLAAVSKPDLCMTREARDLNVVATSSLIELMLKRKVRVLFSSSDAVYGNTEIMSDETSLVKPYGEYAKMEYQVERYFINESNFCSMRFSNILSSHDQFTMYLNNCFTNCNKANVFPNYKRKFILIDDIFEGIKRLCHFEILPKIINFCGSDLLSRVDLAQIYKEKVGSGFNYHVVNEPPDFFNERSKEIDIDNSLLKKILTRDALSVSSNWLLS